MMRDLFVYRVKPDHRSGRGTYWRANRAGYTDSLAEAGLYEDDSGVLGSETAEAVPFAEEQRRIATPTPFVARVRHDVPTFERSELDLLRQVCRRPRPGKGRGLRWAHVAETLSVGSTAAQAICSALDLDPDEYIGEDETEDASDWETSDG
jgi:hypothetical protein